MVRVVGLNTVLKYSKHSGKTVEKIAQEDPQYLLWLNNSQYNIWLSKSVLLRLGVWNSYKDTTQGRDLRVLIK